MRGCRPPAPVLLLLKLALPSANSTVCGGGTPEPQPGSSEAQGPIPGELRLPPMGDGGQVPNVLDATLNSCLDTK